MLIVKPTQSGCPGCRTIQCPIIGGFGRRLSSWDYRKSSLSIQINDFCELNRKLNFYSISCDDKGTDWLVVVVVVFSDYYFLTFLF